MCGLFGNRSLKGDKTANGLQAEHDYPNSRPAQQPTKVSDTSKMPSDQKDSGYAPPSGPPPSGPPASGAPPGYIGSQNTGGGTFSSNNPYASQRGSSGGGSGYAPPSGPPPGQYEGGGGYAPPSGPPPAHNSGGGYAPPSGPPPSNSYAPPPGPPPSSKRDDKDIPYQEPFHDWQNAVPDTALLPPPPSIGEDRSWANNASLSDAENGAAFTRDHPLVAPLQLRSENVEAVEAGDIELMRPFQYVGDVRQLRPRSWTCKARRGSPDACLMSTLPLYSVIAHSPLNIGRKKTIYFEVRIAPHNRSEVSVTLGFVAQPYPPFRLPGWDRAGLGVHGDDGHRYINDCWGGKPFTAPFRPGETLGIGMTLSPRRYDGPPPQYGAPQQCPIDTEVFFTRNGEKAGGWNLHEEGDAEQDRPVTGLEGYHDLFAAVGTFEEAEFEVVFEERNWLYRPDQY